MNVMATAIPNSRSLVRPAKDEWGVYDPEQAGMAALLARLDNKSATKAAASGPAQKKDVPEPKGSARPIVRNVK